MREIAGAARRVGARSVEVEWVRPDVSQQFGQPKVMVGPHGLACGRAPPRHQADLCGIRRVALVLPCAAIEADEPVPAALPACHPHEPHARAAADWVRAACSYPIAGRRPNPMSMPDASPPRHPTSCG